MAYRKKHARTLWYKFCDCLRNASSKVHSCSSLSTSIVEHRCFKLMFLMSISSDIIISIVDNVVIVVVVVSVVVVIVVVPFKVVVPAFGEGGGEVAVHKGAMIIV